MSDNLRYWNKLHKPPASVLKPIQAGRLKGKSDINPQWRMQAMTETYGPCGEGWGYTIDKLWLERAAMVKSKEGNHMAEEVAAFALVSVWYRKDDGEKSEPIPGIGGSMFTEMEKYGPFNSDEAFKMAVTDGLSVAFKALGVAAEVYLGNFDGSKYTGQAAAKPQPAAPADPKDAEHIDRIKAALHTVFGTDKKAALDKVEQLSSFIPKGKTEADRVAGVRDFTKLKGDRLKYLCHGVEKLVPKEVELCNECRQPTTAHAASCPNAQPPA